MVYLCKYNHFSDYYTIALCFCFYKNNYYLCATHHSTTQLNLRYRDITYIYLNMKKNYYNAPECDIVRIGMHNQVLTGSDFGEFDEPGTVPEIDPIINF